MAQRRPKAAVIASAYLDNGCNQKRAAEANGWHEDNFCRWMKEPDVQEAITTATNASFHNVINKLKKSDTFFLDELMELTKIATGQNKVVAIRTGLEYQFKAYEFSNDKRLTEVEAKLAEIKELLEARSLSNGYTNIKS